MLCHCSRHRQVHQEEPVVADDDTRNKAIVLVSLVLLSISAVVVIASAGILIFRRHELIRRKLVHLLGRVDLTDASDVYQVSKAGGRGERERDRCREEQAEVQQQGEETWREKREKGKKGAGESVCSCRPSFFPFPFSCPISLKYL